MRQLYGSRGIPGLIILMLRDYSEIIPLRSIVLKLCWHNWLKPTLVYVLLCVFQPPIRTLVYVLVCVFQPPIRTLVYVL